MVGITSYGGYVPRYRLSRELVGKAMGQRFAGGERAVASFDEDSFTMANEAAMNCLKGVDSSAVGAVYFASVSPPYIEKQISTLIGTVCDLPEGIATADFAGSARASTAALRQALELAGGGSGKQSLVCAADIRPFEPGTDLEQLFGDAAAAVLVGDKDPIASLLGTFSVSEEFLDYWRKKDDSSMQRGDAAFIQSYGYQRIVKKCVKGLLSQQGVGPADVSKLILNALDARGPQSVAKSLEFSEEQFLDPMMGSVGDAGNASALMLLISALEKAQPGDKLLLCNYSAGNADAFLFEVTPAIEGVRDGRRGVSHYMEMRRELPVYEKMLKFRGLLPAESVSPFASATLAWKEIKQNLKLLGVKCQECGRISYPRRHVCPNCLTKDRFDDFRLPSTGTVYTFAKDYLYPSPESPTGMAVVDLDGGGRFYGQVADADPKQIKIGMQVEMVMRRFHEGDGFVNYFWKLRPTSVS